MDSKQSAPRRLFLFLSPSFRLEARQFSVSDYYIQSSTFRALSVLVVLVLYGGGWVARVRGLYAIFM